MKLPLLSGRQVQNALERLGFEETHRRGSHVKMQHSDGRTVVFRFMAPSIATRSKEHWEMQKLALTNS